jgi:HD-GYP domain-containing protein (c-di-GMP phosphodiesterase class II)
LKPGRLTSEEFQVMKTHAMLGIEIVAGNPWLAGAEKTIRLPNGFAGDAT